MRYETYMFKDGNEDLIRYLKYVNDGRNFIYASHGQRDGYI